MSKNLLVRGFGLLLMCLGPLGAEEATPESRVQALMKTRDFPQALTVVLEQADHAASLAGRLQWIKEAADAARQGGLTRTFMTELKKRKEAQQDTALSNLVLVSAYRALGDEQAEEAQLTELEASAKLNVEELLQLAEIQMKSPVWGTPRWQRAQTSLNKAAQMEPNNPRVRNAQALWQVAFGNTEEGLRLFTDLVHKKTVQPEEAETLAMILCERQQWRRAAQVLAPTTQEAPVSNRLLYLAAVCLEEAGQTQAAIEKFKSLVERVKADALAEPLPAYQAKRKLPEDVQALLSAWTYMPNAYQYRSAKKAATVEADLPRRRPTYVALPDTPRAAYSLALLHLRELARHADAKTNLDLTEVIRTNGMERAHEFVNVDVSDNGEPDAAQLLLFSNGPDDTGMYRLWLSCHSWFPPGQDEMVNLERCVNLLQKDFPEEAFQAALLAARLDTPKQAEWRKRALELFRGLKNIVTVDYTFTSLPSETKTWSEAKEWRAALIDIYSAWREALKAQPDGLRSTVTQALSQVLLDDGRYEEYVRVLDDETKHPVSAEEARTSGGIMHGGSIGYMLDGEPLFDAPLFPNYVLRWPSSLIQALRMPMNILFNFYPATPADVLRQQDAAVAKVANQATNPLLRLMLLRLVDPNAAANEITQRLTAADASLADWLVAAWLANEKDSSLAAERLTHATTMPMDAATRRFIDAALVHCVLAAKTPPDAAKQAAREAALRLRKEPLTARGGQDLVAALDRLGLHAEAMELAKNAPVNSRGRYYDQLPNWIPHQFVVEAHVAAGQMDLARSAYVNYLRSESPKLSQGNTHQMFQEVTQNLTFKKLLPREPLLKLADPGENAPASERLAFAGVAELLGDEALAMRNYKAVADTQPWRLEAHMRLAALFTSAHQTDAAVQELQKLEPRQQANLVQEWRNEVASDFKASPEKKAAIHDVLLQWIKVLGSDPKTRLSTSDVLRPLSELLQESDTAMLHESLAVRGLDEISLGLLAHEALKKGDDLSALAGDATRILQSGKRTDNNFTMSMAQNQEGGHYSRPALVLLWNAWQKNRPQDVENVIVPLVLKVMSPDEIRALRLAADLFFVPEDQFPKAAKAFGNDPSATLLVVGMTASHFYPGGPEDFIISVHQKRKLRVPLAPVFVSWVENDSTHYLTFEPVTRYLVRAGLSEEEKAHAIRLIRDALFHEPAEDRVKLIRDFLKDRHHNNAPLTGTFNTTCESYAAWLSQLTSEPAVFRAAMEVAAEDHFTEDDDWMSSAFSSSMGMKRLNDEYGVLAMMEAQGLLEDAAHFRAWKLGRNSPGSQATQIANSLNYGEKKEIGQKVCALLRNRQPRTFGADLMLMLINDGETAPWPKMESITVEFIKSHREQIAQIPPEHRAEVAAVFRSRLRDWDHPEKLDADALVILAPLRESDDSTLDDIVRKILAADNWQEAALTSGDVQSLPVRAFFYLARKDGKKAFELAKKCVALLNAMDVENSRRELDGGNPPSSMWLEHACATAATYRLLRPLLEEEGLMHNANWLSGALSTLCLDSMRHADKVPGFFEAMHFLDEAPQLSLEHFYKDDESSSLEEAIRHLGNSDHRKVLEAYLPQRQPRTFGTELVAALIAKEPAAPLKAFILAHDAEFPKLTPATAAALAGVIRRTFPELGDPRKDAEFARLVQPLLDAEYKDAGTWCDRLLSQTYEGARQQAAFWNERFAAAPALLEVIGLRDPQKAKQVFAHFLPIVKMESSARSNYMDPERTRRILGNWLMRCAGSPALVGPVLEALRESGDPQLLKATLADFGNNSILFATMKKPGYVQAFFQALPFLADAEHFRAYKNDRMNGEGTLLGDVLVGLRIRRETSALTELDRFLAGLKPETFGGDLVKALRHRNRTPQLTNFLKKHSADLVKLTPQGEEDLSILLSRNLSGWNRPETLDAELQSAAAPLIHSARVLTNARVEAILNATDMASTHFSEKEFMKQAPLLLHGLADEDLPKARQFLTKVTELIEASPAQAEWSSSPSSTPVARWLESTADTPQLFKEVMHQAERFNLRGDGYWLTGYLEKLTHEKSFHVPARTLAFLKDSSLLEDAARFDPVSLRWADYGYHTLLELVVSEVGRRESTPELRKLMVKELPLTFGYELLFAMLADDPIAAVADFSVKHAADWKALKPEHRVAMAALLRPMLSRMAAAHAASLPQVNAAVQLLLEAETTRQREVLDRLMKAKTPEEFLKGTNDVESTLTWLFEWMLASGEGDVKAAFAHMAQLYQDRIHSSDMPPKSGLMFQLCALAESPQLRAYALAESASWPFKDDAHFRESISNRYAAIDRLWAGTTASAAKLSSLHFLDAAATFDAFVYGSPRPGSALLVVVVELRSRKAATLRPGLLAWLNEQPATFGRDLMEALLADDPKTTVAAFRRAHGEELRGLPETQRREIEGVAARVMQ